MSKKILKDDLQQEWLSLNEELNKHNYLYHSIDSPQISDFQYDEMKKTNRSNLFNIITYNIHVQSNNYWASHSI